MPTKFERWMRSKDSAMTARDAEETRAFGGQSREDPEPYFFAGEDDERRAALGVLHRGVVNGHRFAFGQEAGDAASVPGASLLRRRTLAKVPRTMTS